MRRVVITGLGIVSSLGNGQSAVTDSLRNGQSGITKSELYGELKLRSRVHGAIDVDPSEHIDRRQLRFMGPAAAYSHIAMQEAIRDAGLAPELISHPRTGLVMGTGGGSLANAVEAADILRERGVKRVGPYMVPRTMTSTVAACLATSFAIKGVNYGIVSACATSAHAIGHGGELIQWGKQDVIFAGGGDEVHWTTSLQFDAMGALSSRRNDDPTRASRPYDADRDGFVISGGGGVVVLEELEHARARGATIYAELVGYGATSDGHDMVQPSGEGAARCMEMALAEVNAPIDYINPHATSTPVGDLAELKALKSVFGSNAPPLSATKSLSGHALGAAGVHEAIYTLIMQRHGFIAASANIEQLDPEAEGFDIVRERRDDVDLATVMSNSFGFGGTNAVLIFQRLQS